MNLNQTYPFIVLNQTAGVASSEIQSIVYPIRRGLVASSGTLNFKVVNNRELNGQISSEDDSYVLMTEFKPANKELIIKDYIEILTEENMIGETSFGSQFIDNARKLKVNARVPGFKPQLLLDYPDLKKIQLKFNFFLFSDSEIQKKISLCGLSSMTQITKVPISVIKNVKREAIANFTVEEPMVDAVFTEDHLEVFKNATFLNVLCYVSVKFFENEVDEWQVSLDLKFASVPYFLLTLPNQFLQDTSFAYLLALAICIFAVLIACGLAWRCTWPHKQTFDNIRIKDDVSYSAPSFMTSTTERTYIEHSNMSQDNFDN
jgi:hypothetical protein